MITIDITRLHLKHHFKVLDIGCGSGRHMGSLFDLHMGLVFGMDTNLSDLKAADERLFIHAGLSPSPHNTHQWHLISGDGCALPFPNHFFDGIILSEVLEHIEDDALAIREALRVLKPGGILGVSVPRWFPEKICWKLSFSYANEPGGHIRIYTKNQLINALTSGGERVKGKHFAHSLHTPYWWLKCFLEPRFKQSSFIAWYHRFLVWDMIKKPKFTRLLDRLLNPILGKSRVVYIQKPMDGSH